VALGVPLIAVNHIEAHVYACRFAPSPQPLSPEGRGGLVGRDIFPCVGFVVSGGHTILFHCKSALDFELLGSTLDDAAGEAFDKVASILGLGFPGGPAVEREAAGGNPRAFKFPRSFLHDDRLDFSFSGLKTAVLYEVHGQNLANPKPVLADQRRADIAASFQQAVIDVLVIKARQALRRTGLNRLAVGGGVSANRALRGALQSMAEQEQAELFIPPLELCTDNAAMAAMAVEKWRVGDLAPLDLDAVPAYSSQRRR
jgi:N6-L-threonylcarbamoyladenine synthase